MDRCNTLAKKHEANWFSTCGCARVCEEPRLQVAHLIAQFSVCVALRLIHDEQLRPFKKATEISMAVKTPSLVEVGLFRLANVKVCHSRFGKIVVICLLLMRVLLFLQLSPRNHRFFWLCFMLSKAHFNSIHYITQMTFKEFQTLPKKHDIARALKNINTFSAEKKWRKTKPTKPTVVFFCEFFQVAQSFRQQARDLSDEDSTKLMVFWGCRKPMDFRQNELKDVKDGFFPTCI